MNSITCNRMVLCLTLINTTTNEHPQSATRPKQSFFGSKDAIQDGCYNHPFSTNKLTHQKQLHKILFMCLLHYQPYHRLYYCTLHMFHKPVTGY